MSQQQPPPKRDLDAIREALPEDLREELDALVAQKDQALMQLGTMAELLHTYHANLCAQGFRREEALHIVVSYQECLMMSQNTGDEN